MSGVEKGLFLTPDKTPNSPVRREGRWMKMMNFWTLYFFDTRMTVTMIFDYEFGKTYDKLLLEFV